MSQLTRTEVNALLKKAAESRRRIEKIEADLQAIAARIASATSKPDRRKTIRKR